MIRLRVPPAGRMKGMRHRWMRFEPYRPQAYFRTPEGIWRKDRRIGRIPFMRPATPRAPICLSALCPPGLLLKAPQKWVPGQARNDDGGDRPHLVPSLACSKAGTTEEKWVPGQARNDDGGRDRPVLKPASLHLVKPGMTTGGASPEHLH